VLFMFLVGIQLGPRSPAGERPPGADDELRPACCCRSASVWRLAFGVADSSASPATRVCLSCCSSAQPSITRFPVSSASSASTPRGDAARHRGDRLRPFDDVTAWAALACHLAGARRRRIADRSLLWLGLYAAIMLTLVRPGLRVLLRQSENGDGRLT